MDRIVLKMQLAARKFLGWRKEINRKEVEQIKSKNLRYK
jgi:hypothetical protein